MPSLNLTIPHELDPQEALERLQSYLAKIVEHYQDQVNNLEQEWSDNALSFAFSAMGMSTKGTVSVEENQVVVDTKIPIAAMVFKGKIEQTVREQLERALS